MLWARRPRLLSDQICYLFYVGPGMLAAGPCHIKQIVNSFSPASPADIPRPPRTCSLDSLRHLSLTDKHFHDISLALHDQRRTGMSHNSVTQPRVRLN